MGEITRENTTIAYEVVGDGPAIVLTHSFLFDRRMWREQIRPLTERGWKVVDVDLRGHGESGQSHDPFSVYDAMDDTLAVLDAEGIGEAVWMGNSIGGFQSLRAALRHPDRVRALVIVDSDAGPEPTLKRLQYRMLAIGASKLGWRAVLPQIMPIMFGPTTRRERKELVSEWSASIAGLDRPSVVAGIAAITGRDDLLPRLGEIAAPTLVVVGEEDKPLPPDRSRLIAAGIPGAELEVIERAGHISPLEQPEAFNAAVFGFLDRL